MKLNKNGRSVYRKMFLLLFLFFQSFFFLTAQNCTVTIIKFQPQGECEGNGIQLIASPTAPGNTYSWNCPNSMYNSTTGPFLFIPYSMLADDGNYTLSVTDSSGCVAVSTINVNVVPKPVVYISGQAFACQGTLTPLYANDMSGPNGPYSYLWETGSTTQSIKIPHNGGYGPHPSCTMTNASGCAASNQTSFMTGTLYPPVATISYNGLSSFCSPDKLLMTATPPQGIQLLYQWRKNGKSIIGANAMTLEAGVSGNYKVIVTDQNGCADTSDMVPVTVYPRPSATVTADGPLFFCQGDSVTLTVASASGFTYQWRKNGVNIPGANAPAYTAKKTGNYKVEVNSNHDCIRLSDKSSVSVGCREEEVMSENPEPFSLTVYPNPAKGDFNFSFRSSSVTVPYFYLYDTQGKEVFKGNLNGTEGLLPARDLPPGLYSLRVVQDSQVKVLRLVHE